VLNRFKYNAHISPVNKIPAYGGYPAGDRGIPWIFRGLHAVEFDEFAGLETCFSVNLIGNRPFVANAV
jgi:hypothetical protein